jgi:hypothetical protein
VGVRAMGVGLAVSFWGRALIAVGYFSAFSSPMRLCL